MLQLFDALSKKNIKLIDKKNINIYMCGPTVYDYIHIGNARPIFLADFILRYLELVDIKYNFLINVTDIDDKIIKRALDENVSENIISEKFTKYFINDLNSLKVIKPNNIIKVTDHVPEIIEFIQQLINKGAAYTNDGNVYFNIKNFEKEYGRLSNQTLNMLIPGNKNEGLNQKTNILDFALWKNTKEGIKYKSPWGYGRPGWHTECSVFNDLYFNDTIDIHIGGIDLKFPHNENERIQFYAKNNIELSRIWVYNGHLSVNGFKMSKSLNNTLTIQDFILEYGVETLRFLFFNTNYKSPLNISKDVIDASKKWIEKHEKLIKTLNWKVYLEEVVSEGCTSDKIGLWNSKIINYFEDDLNLPMIVTIIDEVYKSINYNLKIGKINKNVLNFYKNILKKLGFCSKIKELVKEDKNLLSIWKQALKDKNYSEADRIRNILIDKGIF
ncbi:cysteine--tRNA ligase [Spiroplasma endosymbiont of Aspidapion aeneum]|uniref:cysteine--tRNA ligase n=1 Tax=Spiroplasma endosymbiont of Aspidapion aeneum TaxID=3066276 RepID=UPI00313D618F